MIAQTLEKATVAQIQERPEPMRIIRKIDGRFQWVYVQPSELTEDERRAIYVAAFGIYE